MTCPTRSEKHAGCSSNGGLMARSATRCPTCRRPHRWSTRCNCGRAAGTSSRAISSSKRNWAWTTSRGARGPAFTAPADLVDDDPAAVPLLDVGQRERDNLGAAQVAAEDRGQDGAVAHAPARRRIRCVEQPLGVDLAQPVAGAGAGRGHAPDPGHAGGELRVEQAVVGGLVGQGADGRELLVDGRGRQAGVEQQGAVALDGGPIV
jgi:hypothetical protein